MKAIKIVFFLPLAACMLSAMENATTKDKSEKYNWKKFELLSSILLPKGKDQKNDFRITTSASDNFVEFQIHERSLWGNWEVKKYNYLVSKVNSRGKLINIKDKGLRRINDDEYLSAFILTYLAKNGENLQIKEECVIAKFNAMTKILFPITYLTNGKISKLKFAVNPGNSETKLTLYTHADDCIDKTQVVFNCETFAKVQKAILLKRWKMTKENLNDKP